MNTAANNIKVLHVYRTYFPDSQGGAQEVIRQICQNTVCHGVENRIFSPSENPQPKKVQVDETSVIRVKLNFEIASCGFCFTGLAEFQKQLNWADIVHYHFPWPFADFMHLLCGKDQASIVTYHSDIVRQQGMLKLYSPLMSRFLSKMDCIAATSPNYQASSDVLKKYKSKVKVVPIGIEDSAYPALQDAILDMCKRQYGEHFFFFVGVLRYYKGLHILIDACRDAGFKVVIAGSGPLDAQLRQQVKDLGVDNVQFAGQVSDEEKVALYTLCRAVVFSSHVRSEAFGVTLLEGAMFGKPLISAETGSGTSYVNKAGETGLVVKADDSAALRDAMDLLHEDDAQAKLMGANARKRYERLFTGKSMGKAYVELYKEVINNRLGENVVSEKPRLESPKCE